MMCSLYVAETFHATTFYFIRHGQVNPQIQLADTPLSNEGEMQAQVAAKILKTVQFAKIITSPLSRALGTALIIAGESSLDVAPCDELKEKNKEETSDQFEKRIDMILEKMLSYKGLVLIVSHGDVYQAIQKKFQIDQTFIGNCMPVCFRYNLDDYLWSVYDLS